MEQAMLMKDLKLIERRTQFYLKIYAKSKKMALAEVGRYSDFQ